TRGPYNAEYPIGSSIRIAPREVLEGFAASWQFHHPLASEQLGFAGRVARVKEVGFYHGGDELYSLQDIPGLWHEQLLFAESTHPHRRGVAIGLGLLAATAVATAVYVALMLLGAKTGVVAMCPSAPEWWAYTFFGLLLVAPIAGAVLTGVRVGRWYRRKA